MFSRKSSAAAAETPAAKLTAEKTPNVSPAPSSAPPSEEAQKRTLHAIRQSLAFAQITSLLVRSPVYRHFALADLEWLVIPPLATGMFAVAEVKAQPDGPGVPAAAVLWASVSPEVDARLSGNAPAPIRLRPDEWRSGDQLWIIAAVGDERVTSGLLQQLGASAFKGRKVKIRLASGDGTTVSKTLDEIFAAKEPAA